MKTNTPASLPFIPCVILAGGQSRRFGSNKALADLQGQRLIDHVIARLEAQSSGPVAINTAHREAFDLPHRTFLADQVAGDIGPLAGLHTALTWAAEQGFEHVVTTPVDTPLLPEDFIARLVHSGPPAVVEYGGRVHPLHGIWPTVLQDPLATLIGQGMRAARDWITRCDANMCVFPAAPSVDPFSNINTPDDLAALTKD